MTEKNVTITIAEGLTAKNITAIIEKANEFSCVITTCCGARHVNCKSLLGMLSLGLRCGDSITLSADGEGEAEAVDAIAAML